MQTIAHQQSHAHITKYVKIIVVCIVFQNVVIKYVKYHKFVGMIFVYSHVVWYHVQKDFIVKMVHVYLSIIIIIIMDVNMIINVVQIVHVKINNV